MKKLIVLLSLFLTSCSSLHFNSGNQVYINDIIEQESTDKFLKEFVPMAQRAEPGDEIVISINSPGGSVPDGMRIIEAIKSAKEKGIKVTTLCTSMCASMAAIILEFGSERQALGTAIIMFHHIYYANDPGRRDEFLLVTQHAVLEEMGELSGVPEPLWILAFKLKGDLWFSAKDALRSHLIDKIIVLKLENI